MWDSIKGIVGAQLRELTEALSGLMVALDMIEQHKHTKAWSLEVVLVTDGESEFSQEEFEEAMERFDNLGVRLSVV